jgi:hypothetical protein
MIHACRRLTWASNFFLKVGSLGMPRMRGIFAFKAGILLPVFWTKSYAAQPQQ